MSARDLAIAGVALLLGLAACSGVVREEPLGGSGSSGGVVGPHVCVAGFADCDGDPADGCEADLEHDAVHCGACGRDCQGQPCTDGMCEPQVLASELYFPSRIAVDAARVYWTSPDGTINALPLAGGAKTTLVAGKGSPWDLAVDAAGVYWTNDDSNTVEALPFGAAAPTLLAEAGNPFGVVVRSGVVYFTDTYDKLSYNNHVMRAPLPAGPPSVVATTPGAYLLAVDATRAYWTDHAGGAVWSAPLGGGAPTLLASPIVEPTEIEVDGDAVYVAALEATYRIPLAGGAPAALIWGAGLGLAIDATHVYVGTADGRILKVPKTGGAALALARTELYPSDLAVDDAHVYWTERAEVGALVRTPK